jgi:hypothetical protein
MHRVELKVTHILTYLLCDVLVPNAPCGVESLLTSLSIASACLFVPNAPCGVESAMQLAQEIINHRWGS